MGGTKPGAGGEPRGRDGGTAGTGRAAGGDDPVEAELAGDPSRRGYVGWFAAHPLLNVAILLVIGGAVVLGYKTLAPLVSPEYQNVDKSPPAAQQLTAGAGETVLRIDPAQSQASYEAKEKIGGAETSTATGVTQGVAGDVALNTANPSASRVGQIVVNLEQLTSDNSLRDARIRAEYLESHAHPNATFDTTSLTGLPASLDDGGTASFTITGNLLVKTTTKPATWQASGTYRGGTLTLDASTTVTMSDFGIGPISIIGLVSTEDAVTLHLHLVLVDPQTHAIGGAPTPDLAAGTTAIPISTGVGPSYAKQVQPILEANCVSCHRSGESGAETWRLDTAADAHTYASGIATVTRTQYMPPWPPGVGGVPLQHDRTLAQADIDTLQQWSAAGGPIDVDQSTPLMPSSTPAGPSARHDVTMAPTGSYQGDGSTDNDYRCFALDPKFASPSLVTGSDVIPGNRSVVHHVLYYRVTAAMQSQIDARTGTDGRPGWSCYGGPGVSAGPDDGPDLIGGWVPGQVPLTWGAGEGFLFDPGDLVIMQVHYHYHHGAEPDQTQLALQVDAPAPGTKQLTSRIIGSPVEIPCATGVTGPLCDRNAAEKALNDKYGPVSNKSDQLLKSCRQTVADYQHMTPGRPRTTCDHSLGVSGDLLAVTGHMHTLGTSYKLTLNPGTPDEKVLLDLPQWDFNWQLTYQLATPVHISATDVVRVECSWDRSLNPKPDPRYILWSEGTEDEMCLTAVTFLPDKQPR